MKLTLNYLLILIIVVLLSCFFHEFAHWATGELLGNKMTMSMNTVSTVADEYAQAWHREWVTLAGPVFTIVQAVVFYLLLKRTKNINLYPLVFFPFVYRLFAGMANSFSPNDEGRLGQFLDIGLYTLSILVTGFLLYLVIRSSKLLKIGFKINLISFVVCTVMITLVVFADQYFKIRIF